MKSIIEPLLQQYQEHITTPESIARDLLARIDASTLNAFVSVCRDRVLAEARSLEDKATDQPLHGIAVAVKDLIDVEGYRTTLGSAFHQDNVASADAEVVTRIKAAGAIVIGKANTHQFAYGPMGDRSYAGPVHNPHNPEHMTGGSSSGSAAAVAAGLAHAALGTDTAASVRLPAAFCGVVGMKPTKGLIPDSGVFPLSKTLDHVGPITADCRDNARLLAVLADRSLDTYQHRIGQPVAGCVVGLPDRFFNTYWSDDIRAAMDTAIEVLRKVGVEVRPVALPGIEDVYEKMQPVQRAEAYALHAQWLDEGKPYDLEVRERLLSAKDILAVEYLQALAFQNSARACFDHAFQHVDVILTPTCGITSPRLQERETMLNGETVSTRWLLTRLTGPTNFSGHPSLSVPFGKDLRGLPVGLQLIGPYHEEAKLYQLGDFLAR